MAVELSSEVDGEGPGEPGFLRVDDIGVCTGADVEEVEAVRGFQVLGEFPWVDGESLGGQNATEMVLGRGFVRVRRGLDVSQMGHHKATNCNIEVVPVNKLTITSGVNHNLVSKRTQFPLV